MDALTTILTTTPPSTILQTCFLLVALSILLLHLIPTELTQVLMLYGARSTSPTRTADDTTGKKKPKRPGLLAKLADSIQVPHSTFRHFYFFSVCLSLFWMIQYRTGGNIMTSLARHQIQTSQPSFNEAQYHIPRTPPTPQEILEHQQRKRAQAQHAREHQEHRDKYPHKDEYGSFGHTLQETVVDDPPFPEWYSPNAHDSADSPGALEGKGKGNGEGQLTLNPGALLTMPLLLVQGGRRLYEDLYITKTSSRSKMLVLHWLLAVGFYGCMSVAVWIEGVGFGDGPTIPRPSNLPIPKTIIALLLFTHASVTQHTCHKHISSLRKYTLPSEGLFSTIISPHYMAECLIYLSLTLLSSPTRGLNKTMLSALVFVVINLGVTASGTKRWYASKFGQDAVRGRWKMIPYVF